jgi:hypothetical protein
VCGQGQGQGHVELGAMVISSAAIRVVVPVLALGAAAFMAAGGWDFCLDDAWIHLAYAKSLKLGDGFAYNPGDRETGFSSPLWALLLALWPWGSDPVLPVKALGALCHAALACGSSLLVAQLMAAERARTPALVAGLLVACDPLLAFAAVSGMEVSLTAALAVWTLVAAQRLSAGPASLAAVGGGVLLGAAGVLARPESLFLIGAFATLAWSSTRRRAVLWPLLGALLALGAWVLYCQLVSGHPWPNTYYAKRHADLGSGLAYFGLRVLTAQAWSFGLSGLVLVGLAVARPGPARTLALAWLSAVVAIAASRELLMNVLFYCSRYFAIFAAIPCVLVASQLPERRLWRALVLAPIVAANLWLLPAAHRLQRAQEDDIFNLHTQPAQFAAKALPKDARVLVEGAGATRFFLPRTMHVIDYVGLNYAAAVHARTLPERLCAVLRARPTHVLLPDGYLPTIQRVVLLEPMRSFVDPASALSIKSKPHFVAAARVAALRAEARAMCGL